MATGVKTTVRRRYKAEAMAFWLHLVPKLHRAEHSGPVFHSLHADNSTDRTVSDDVTVTQAGTTSTAKTLFRSSEDGFARKSFGLDGLETSGDGLLRNSSSVSASAGVGGKLLQTTVAVGCGLLLINCVVFVAMAGHRSRRFRELTATKQLKPITYVSSYC